MKTFVANRVTKSYGGKPILKNISLQLQTGQIVGLLGPNGAGKTTSFHMLTGLEQPDSGEIFIDDENITELPLEMRARYGMAYLPQEPSIFRSLTVRENVISALEIRGGLSQKEMDSITDGLIQELGLTHLSARRSVQLSGGECRRVEIARAVACKPDFLLLDEPFAGIDPIAVRQVMVTMNNLRGRDIGLLITDHNVPQILEVSSYIYIVNEGEIAVEGTPDKVVEHPIARAIFFGENF